MSIVELILGRRLANREYVERKISAFEGVPAMWLHGLGSSAYGPEAVLTILIPLGAAGLAHIGGSPYTGKSGQGNDGDLPFSP
jgi:hypothetical protein